METMKKKGNLSRWAIQIKAYGFFDTVEEAREKLNIQIEELQYRLFDGEQPAHVAFQFEEDLDEFCAWAYFYSERPLNDMDEEILVISEDFEGFMGFHDFDNRLTQGYDSGEYDTGMFSQPEDRASYEEHLLNTLNNPDTECRFPILME